MGPRLYIPSRMLVPALVVSSAAFLVLSCNLAVSSGLVVVRSALTAASLSDASSGFQWPWPFFCFARESFLCLSKSMFSAAAGVSYEQGGREGD